MKQILGLLGMYFDAVVVEVKTFLLLFRLALAILCLMRKRLRKYEAEVREFVTFLKQCSCFRKMRKKKQTGKDFSIVQIMIKVE